jgi:hypothetical protein
VLARAAADDENSHELNGLGRATCLHRRVDTAGVISLTLTGITPRIRVCCDSLAHLHTCAERALPHAKGVLVAWLK